MMRPLPEKLFDVASAISQGKREYQEDTIITDFPIGSDIGFAVLADGMGGHASGDIASKIVVTEVFSELKLQISDTRLFEENITDILLDAALSANECVSGHVNNNPESSGMGATLIAPVFVENRLYWISVGDSPLFLYRGNELTQLNEDHSMAPQIDYMFETGQIGEETAKNHPDRNCLTSVLIGDEISRIDCPTTPVDLQVGDILVMASDGLQFLSNNKIENILSDSQSKSSLEISQILLQKLEELGDPDQDNISFSVIKFAGSVSIPEKPILQFESEPAFSAIRPRDVGAAILSAGQSAMNTFRSQRGASDASDTTS